MRKFQTLSNAFVAFAMLLVANAALATDPTLRRTGPVDELALKNEAFVPASPPIINGSSAMYSGTTVGGPTYNRLTGNCGGVSGVGTAVSYQTQNFTVAANGNYALSSAQTYDGYLFVYQGTFNPAAPATNCLAGNDDGAGGIGTSDIASVALTTGVTYIAVTTGFANDDFGTFDNTITGPGTITLGGGGGPTADLGITKTAPGGVQVGANYTYLLTAINNGPGAATAVMVTDVLPAGVSLVSNTCGAMAAGQVVTWNIGALANAATASCTLTVSLAGNMCVAVSNTAVIAGAEADPVAANNSSTTMNGGGNVVADGSFEAGASGDSPNWIEASSNFGTPLCTVASCGTGSGTGPRTGLVWTWFGGIDASEIGSMQQTLTIPAGAASVTFYTEYPVCNVANGASDFVRLTIDGTELWRADATSPRCGALGYQQETVPLGALADGASHVLRFESTIVGNGGGTNFFVDDVAIQGSAMCGFAMADLALTQSNNQAGALMVGSTFQKMLTVTNNGPGASSAITVSDTLPAQLTFVSSNCGATAVGQVVTYTIPALANGASNTCSITVSVNSQGTIINTASITSSTPPDGNVANNTTSQQIGPTGGGIVQRAVPALDLKSILVLLGLVTLLGSLALRQRQA